MSARRRQLIVRPDAQVDIRDILLYTLARWSSEQRRRYRGDLDRAMRSLLIYPELGPSRNDLFPGCRNLAINEHVVFYTIADNEIVVLRVLHGNQDPSGKVGI